MTDIAEDSPKSNGMRKERIQTKQKVRYYSVTTHWCSNNEIVNHPKTIAQHFVVQPFVYDFRGQDVMFTSVDRTT
eukprot:6479818-Amphidinium_carterae.1